MQGQVHPSGEAIKTGVGARPAAVMLIDDDGDLYVPIHAVVERALGAGSVLWHYTEGLRAVRDLHERRPHLVLLDMRLPDVDGLTVLKLIKATTEFRHIPVIMLSGHAYWQMLSIALDAGADSYIFKPFEFETLVSVIRESYHRTRADRPAAPGVPDPPAH